MAKFHLTIRGDAGRAIAVRNALRSGLRASHMGEGVIVSVDQDTGLITAEGPHITAEQIRNQISKLDQGYASIQISEVGSISETAREASRVGDVVPAADYKFAMHQQAVLEEALFNQANLNEALIDRAERAERLLAQQEGRVSGSVDFAEATKGFGLREYAFMYVNNVLVRQFDEVRRRFEDGFLEVSQLRNIETLDDLVNFVRKAGMPMHEFEGFDSLVAEAKEAERVLALVREINEKTAGVKQLRVQIDYSVAEKAVSDLKGFKDSYTQDREVCDKFRKVLGEGNVVRYGVLSFVGAPATIILPYKFVSANLDFAEAVRGDLIKLYGKSPRAVESGQNELAVLDGLNFEDISETRLRDVVKGGLCELMGVQLKPVVFRE